MDNWIKKHLRSIVGYCYRLMLMANSNVIYYTSKILKLKSEANIADIEDIKRSRRKNTIFIMGSGYSINDITKEEWQHIVDVGDILSFNYFFKGKFVPINYHICGETGAPNYGLILINNRYKKNIKAYYEELFSNPYYKDTLYFLRYKTDFTKAPVPIALWALLFLKAFKNKQVCPYRIVIQKDAFLAPSDNIYSVTHCGATLFDAINIAYLLGYKKIVLAGVDLYDSRYFWLKENDTREGDLKSGASCNDVHNTADIVLKAMSIWKEYLEKRGVELYIYNPRSLLHTLFPLYKFR